MNRKQKTKMNTTRSVEVMVFAPGGDGDLRTIDGSVESLAKIVGGPVEIVRLPNPATGNPLPGIAVACHEEGRLLGLQPSRWGFVGAFAVVRVDGAALASLTDADKRLVDRLVLDDFAPA